MRRVIFWLPSTVGVVVDVPYAASVSADVLEARYRAVEAGLATHEQLIHADVEPDAPTQRMSA